MDPVTAGTALAGFLAPMITWLLNRVTDDDHKQLLALAVAVLLGVVALGLTGGFNEPSWGVNLLAVLGVSQAIFTLIIKPGRSLLEAQNQRTGQEND